MRFLCCPCSDHYKWSLPVFSVYNKIPNFLRSGNRISNYMVQFYLLQRKFASVERNYYFINNGTFVCIMGILEIAMSNCAIWGFWSKFRNFGKTPKLKSPECAVHSGDLVYTLPPHEMT